MTRHKSTHSYGPDKYRVYKLILFRWVFPSSEVQSSYTMIIMWLCSTIQTLLWLSYARHDLISTQSPEQVTPPPFVLVFLITYWRFCTVSSNNNHLDPDSMTTRSSLNPSCSLSLIVPVMFHLSIILLCFTVDCVMISLIHYFFEVNIMIADLRHWFSYQYARQINVFMWPTSVSCVFVWCTSSTSSSCSSTLD